MKPITVFLFLFLIICQAKLAYAQQSPVISLHTSETSIAENAKTYVSIEILSDISLADNIEIEISISGTATYGIDFLNLPSTFFISQDGSTIIPIVPIDDSDLETDENVTVEILSGSGYTVGTNNSVTLSIIDDDSLNYGTIVKIGSSAPASYTYQWQFVDYGCGGDYSTWSDWSDWDGSCAGDNQESRTRTCNNEANGTSLRTIWCQRSDGLNMGDVPDVYLGCETSNRPEATPACSRGCIGEDTEDKDCYTYAWYTGGWSGCQGSYDDWSSWSGWSGCSASCGWGSKTRTRYCLNNNRGYQTRTVYCRRSDGTSVSDSYCSGSKPNSSQSCSRGCSGSSSESQSCWQKPCCRSWYGSGSRCQPHNNEVEYHWVSNRDWCQNKCEEVHATCCQFRDDGDYKRCTTVFDSGVYIYTNTDSNKSATLCN